MLLVLSVFVFLFSLMAGVQVGKDPKVEPIGWIASLGIFALFVSIHPLFSVSFILGFGGGFFIGQIELFEEYRLTSSERVG